MREKISKLKNGGILIYEKSKLNNCSAVEVGFSVGAIADKKAGTAHFLEHNLFKKTKNRSNLQVEFDRNKIAFLNASTSMDYILLKFFRTNKLIEKSFEFAQDILLNSVIDDEYIESEKGVIKEELNMCLDNESRDVYVKNLKQALSKSKFASDIVGGSETNISSITFEDILKFKKKHFVGNNFIVSVVSSLSSLKMKKLINKYFVNYIKFNEKYIKPKSYFDSTFIDQDSSVNVVQNNQEKSMVMMSFKINANEIEIFTKNYNYSFLTKFLSGSQGELFLKLRNKGLIYRFDSDISSFKNESLFNIVFETSKEKIKDILEIISSEIDHIVNDIIDESVTNSYVKNLEYFADEKMPIRPTSKCHMNLMDYLSFNKVFNITKKQKAKLRKGVTPENVKKVANVIFNKNNKIYVTVLGNVESKYVPSIDYFKEKFLLSEIEIWKRIMKI